METTKDIIKIKRRITNICDNYKPFINSRFHIIFDNCTSLDSLYFHYLIFAVWFCSNLNIPVHNIDFPAFYPLFKHIPFHSFLFYIKSLYNRDMEI